jgi:hypothetical protein
VLKVLVLAVLKVLVLKVLVLKVLALPSPGVGFTGPHLQPPWHS